jgi:hypothetical protein
LLGAVEVVLHSRHVAAHNAQQVCTPISQPPATDLVPKPYP